MGRGILVFDDGWHKLSTALWLFGPLREVRAWVGGTEVMPEIEVDAPTTIVWEHQNGIRGVWDITLAPEMYLRSDYYTNDERWEVTGRRGYSRVNRCTGRGIQQPSLETYIDGEMRTYHALDDDWGSSFRDSGRHWLRWLRTGEGPMLWSAEEAVDVLRFALAVYASSAAGGAGIDPASIAKADHGSLLVEWGCPASREHFSCTPAGDIQYSDGMEGDTRTQEVERDLLNDRALVPGSVEAWMQQSERSRNYWLKRLARSERRRTEFERALAGDATALVSGANFP